LTVVAFRRGINQKAITLVFGTANIATTSTNIGTTDVPIEIDRLLRSLCLGYIENKHMGIFMLV
jgi:hypothetical protein